MAINLGGNIGFRKIFGGGGSGTFGPGVTLGFNIPFGVNAVNVQDVGKGKNLTTKDNSITRIKAHAVGDGLYSRPTLFNLFITALPKGSDDPGQDAQFAKDWSYEKLKKIGFNCHQISIPSNNIATKPRKTYGLKREYAYDKLFEEITSSFYLSEKMDEYYFFENWQSLMYKPNQSIGWYNDYTSTIEIHQLSRNLSSASGNDLGIVCKFRLLDAYPKLISPLALDYSRTNDIQKFTVNWTFRDMIIETPNKENPYNNLWKDRDFLNKGKDFINEGESLFKDVVFL